MTADKHDDSQAIGIQTMELDVSNIGQRIGSVRLSLSRLFWLVFAPCIPFKRSTGSRSERHKDKKRPPCRGVPDRSDGVERVTLSDQACFLNSHFQKLKGLLAEVDGRKRSSLVAVGKNVKAFTKGTRCKVNFHHLQSEAKNTLLA